MGFIEVSGLTVLLEGQSVLESLSFCVEKGQKVCIAGGSGSGKTTLFKCLMGFVENNDGEIRVEGELLDSETVWGIRRKISYVSQEPDLGKGLVIDRVREPFGYKSNAGIKFDENRLFDWCGRFRLDKSTLQKDVSQLSGGEKQRIALILGFMLERPILILDEPVSALDKYSKKVLGEVLAEMEEKTVLFSSHDEILMEISGRIVDVKGGE